MKIIADDARLVLRYQQPGSDGLIDVSGELGNDEPRFTETALEIGGEIVLPAGSVIVAISELGGDGSAHDVTQYGVGA